jgi:general secretion pathway protein G
MELLASMAIIAILAGLLIVGVGKVRQTAQATQTTSNLQQIAQGILLYGAENNQKLPELVNMTEAGRFGSDYWTIRIKDYLPTPTKGWWRDFNGRQYTVSPVLVSPLMENGRHHYIADYGANRDVIRYRAASLEEPMRLSDIPNPGQVAMVMTAETTSLNPSVGSWFVHSASYIGNPDSPGQPQIPATHGSEYIYSAFVDGHVAAISPEEFKERRRELLLVQP